MRLFAGAFSNGVDAAHIAETLETILPEAHQAGVLYGDFKPSNICLRKKDGDVQIFLTDWDFCVLKEELEDRTLKHGGTKGFQAPETVAEGEYTIRSESYCFGRVLEEIVVAGTKYKTSRWKTLPSVQ